MQIVVFLRRGILTGAYTGRTPTTSFLSREFDCGKSTVQRAYGIVKNDGLVGIAQAWDARVLNGVRPRKISGDLIEVLAKGQRVIFCQKCWMPVDLESEDGHACETPDGLASETAARGRVRGAG